VGASWLPGEWRHSLAVNTLALASLSAVLFIAGLVLLVLSNVDQKVRRLEDDLRVDVYLRDAQGTEAPSAMIARLEALGGVERVRYVGKDEALRRYQEWAADLAELVNDLDSNPLPASLEVYVRSGGSAAEVAATVSSTLAGDPGVEEVRFNGDWMQRLESVLELARVGGAGLGVLVFGAAAFVMSSVLRLAVLARSEEIEIMRLVGATPAFIRGPFLVAGAVQGLLSAVLAALAVEGVRAMTLAWAGSGSSAALVSLVAAEPLSPALAGLLLLAGLAVNLIGAFFAVRGSTTTA
jgi:cell division transport system permease protein